MSINSFEINGGLINGSVEVAADISLSLTDIFNFADSFQTSQLLSLIDSIAFVSLAESKLVETKVYYMDTILFSEVTEKLALLAIEDLYATADEVSVGSVVASIIDSLGLADSILAISTITKLFESSFGLSDELNVRQRIEQEDAFNLVDDIFAIIRRVREWQDTIGFSDSVSQTFFIELLLSDSLSLADSFFETIQKVLSLQDTFGLVGQFTLDGDSYLVWGMNPRTQGAYKLKYPIGINSMTRIGGKNLLCAPSGIYQVEGKDDEGAEIEAFLKTGFEDFNDPERHYPGEKIKQLLSAYLVLSTDGETLLKVTQTRRGTAEEVWFKCRETNEVMSKKQIPLSNSLRSVLFQFELTPLRGAASKIRELEVIPLFLSRSI